MIIAVNPFRRVGVMGEDNYPPHDGCCEILATLKIPRFWRRKSAKLRISSTMPGTLKRFGCSRISDSGEPTSRESIVSQQEVTDLAADLKAYVVGTYHSKREQASLRRIRSLPQTIRQQLLVPLLDINATVALSLAHRTQLSTGAYLAIFQRGLDEADTSSVGVWMKGYAICTDEKAFQVIREHALGTTRTP